MGKDESIIVKISNKIGMDKSIAYGSGARVVQTVAGVVSLFFIATFLTKVEQGYFFTFMSLLGIQTFFELGFTSIITQFVAHEASHLELKDDNTLSGEERYKSRLSSLLYFSVKWYGVSSVLFLIVSIVCGYILFGDSDEVQWQRPWLIICFATAIKMFQSPLTAIFMGFNKVKDMNKIVFIQQVIMPLVMWLLMFLHYGLYAIGAASVISVLVWFLYIINTDLHSLMVKLFKNPIKEKTSYFQEIFPYQWRIAISSLSGYFIFYFLTPILFKYQGAIVAGQVGMSISVISAIQAFSMNWLNTKVPLYSQLIALNRFTELDSLFSRTMKQMLLVCSCLMVVAFCVLTVIGNMNIGIIGSALEDRFLKGIPLALLMMAYFTDQFTLSWGTYLRCHKKEPYMWLSLITGISCLLIIWITAVYFDLTIIVLGYAAVKVLTTPLGYYIYKDKKNKWHTNI